MRQKINSWLQRYGTHLCAFVAVVATLASESCRLCWYQPEEPEGLDVFVAKPRR